MMNMAFLNRPTKEIKSISWLLQEGKNTLSESDWENWFYCFGWTIWCCYGLSVTQRKIPQM